MRRTAATTAMAGTTALVRAAAAGKNPVVVVAPCGRGGQDDNGGNDQCWQSRTMPMGMATQHEHPESLQPVSCRGQAWGILTRGLI
jgi:hypothetical protein